MSKKDEALKLALGELQAGKVGIAMQILREALAEQPAQYGWKLVPIEPTEEMLATVRQKPHPTRPDGWDDRHTAIYQAMLSAAPQPAQQEPVATLLLQSKQNFERNFGPCWQADWIYSDLVELMDTTPPAAPVRELASKLHGVRFDSALHEHLNTRPAAPVQDEFLLRGILASELKCWHRLTEDEEINLLAFVKNMAPKPAPVQEPSTRACRSCGGSGERDTGIAESPIAICKPCAGTGQITTPPAAPVQEEIQRLTALVRAQQITIEKLEARRQWVGLTKEDAKQAILPLCVNEGVAERLVEVSMDEYRAIEAAHGIKENT